MSVSLARVYDDPGDGRVLVDRLWPRGMRKEDPRVGHWLKDVAPSSDLRTWYHANPDEYDAFAARYRTELDDPDGIQADALTELVDLAKNGDVELATASKHIELSALPTLADVLSDRGAD
ncbi:DUF488 domain-containing protein [Gordonia shandongensis]|uniref:DUF488 domain-containing protein n=1 Tax=Gordonia shandongensis TaxID=376351 RepID=UPI0004190E2B|nr:DUF488 family protein [Gordonia shandongensis]